MRGRRRGNAKGFSCYTPRIFGVDPELKALPHTDTARTQENDAETNCNVKVTEGPVLLMKSGEPRRTRTSNPLIKSQLLYH